MRAIESLDIARRTPAEVVRAIDAAARAVLVGDTNPELNEHRRVALLLAREPDLAASAAAQEEVLIQRLGDRFEEQLGDRLTARLLADVALAVWRTTWRHWAELSQTGAAVNPADCYGACLRALRTVVGPPE